MIKSIRRYIKWNYLRKKLAKKKKLIADKYFDDENQKKAIHLVQKTIDSPISELSYFPDETDFYIKLGDLIIIFNRRIVRISSTDMKYDDIINDMIFENLSVCFLNKIKNRQNKINKELDRRHDEMLNNIKGL